MFCYKCGAKVQDDANFCYSCGTKLAQYDDNGITNDENINNSLTTTQDLNGDELFKLFKEYSDEKSDKHNPELAQKYLLESALKKNLYAIHRLVYEDKEGKDIYALKDSTKRIELAKMGVENGYDTGMYILSKAYLRGDGVSADFEQAIKWLLDYTEKETWARVNVIEYYLGHPEDKNAKINRNIEKAEKMCELFMDKGDAYPCLYLAEMYMRGCDKYHIEKDKKKAINYLEKIHNGNFGNFSYYAGFFLAECHECLYKEKSDNDNEYEKSIEYYKELAQLITGENIDSEQKAKLRNNIDLHDYIEVSMIKLGELYSVDVNKNHKDIVKWYGNAIKEKRSEEILNGRMDVYYHSNIGKSIKLKKNWFDVCEELYELYKKGYYEKHVWDDVFTVLKRIKDGLRERSTLKGRVLLLIAKLEMDSNLREINYVNAFYDLNEATDRENYNAEAMVILGDLCRKGIGTKQDDFTACYCYKTALEGGYDFHETYRESWMAFYAYTLSEDPNIVAGRFFYHNPETDESKFIIPLHGKK